VSGLFWRGIFTSQGGLNGLNLGLEDIHLKLIDSILKVSVTDTDRLPKVSVTLKLTSKVTVTVKLTNCLK
jgi:hypothetical protein